MWGSIGTIGTIGSKAPRKKSLLSSILIFLKKIDDKYWKCQIWETPSKLGSCSPTLGDFTFNSTIRILKHMMLCSIQDNSPLKSVGNSIMEHPKLGGHRISVYF